MQAMSPAMTRSRQGGFTLIELVMVIVILGILSAFALPRFADLGGDANEAVVKGAHGSVKAAMSISHAKWQAAGQTGTIDLEGSETITMAGGYPQAGGQVTTPAAATGKGIAEAAQLASTDYTLDYTSGSGTLVVSTDDTDCRFTYTEGADADAATSTAAKAATVGAVDCSAP